jgi:hypothetical protein
MQIISGLNIFLNKFTDMQRNFITDGDENLLLTKATGMTQLDT